MRKLKDYHPPGLVLAALGFTKVRLSSREAFRPLADEVEAQRTTVTSAVSARDVAREERIASTAEVDWRDGELDVAVMSLSRAVLAVVNGDRDSPMYKRLFPIAPSKAMDATATPAQSRYVRALLETQRAQAQYAEFQPQAEAIASALTAVEQAVAARQDLYVKEAQAQGALTQALDAARRHYNKLYPRLQLLEDNTNLVESLFYNWRSDSGEPTPEETPTS